MISYLDLLIEGIRSSRRYFLNHIKGLRDDQWDWKPYPECKSIRETLAHLIADDRATIHMLETGQFPDFGSLLESETGTEKLESLLSDSHEKLCEFIKAKFSSTPLDTLVNFWEGPVPLAQAITGISSEDYYHAGQVAFIRMATDPGWDYYRSIYNFAE